MANPVGQVVTAIASIITLILAYVTFGPIIDGIFSSLVYETIAAGAGTMLDTNSGSLILTVKILLMGWKIFAFFVIFGILSRLFIFMGYLYEEEPIY